MGIEISEIELSRRDKEKGLVLPTEISSDLAYLLGVFAGDGSMYYNLKTSHYCLKCVGNPKDEKEFYRNVLIPKFNLVFGFSPEPRLHDGNTTYGFTVLSKALCNYLILLGLPNGRKYNSLKIPEVLESCQILEFIRGLYDTDGCMTFKRKYRKYPYYPVISLCSRSTAFAKEVASLLKILDFRVSETYQYKAKDSRVKKGYSIRNWVELNGEYNFQLWIDKIGFFSPKHLSKVRKAGRS